MITVPTIGQDPWGVDLNATLDQIGDLATNVTDAAYGATGDGVTNDTPAVQAAITAVGAAGGGIVYFPAGTYLVSALTVPAKVRLVGAGPTVSTIKKSANGVLVSMSGPSTDTTSATHVKYGGIENLGLNGNSLTGNLLQLYYADNMRFSRVHFTSNNDIMVDTAEFWDSQFLNCTFETVVGAANSTTPMVYLRNSAAASGFGFSADNVNNIAIIGCRFENFTNGALRIDQGVNNTNNPNVIFVTDCKMETSAIRGGLHLIVADECRAVYVNGLYCFSGGFFSGFATAQNVIGWAPQSSSLENVHIANGAVATINSGVDLFSGASSTASLRNVVGQYTTAPTGAHIFYEASSTADFKGDNVYGSTGAQSAGTVPIRWAGQSPFKQVAGVPTDADFTHTPLDGTAALDTATNTLYVRIAGSWVLVGAGAAATGDVQTFTTPGANTWTKPAGAKTVTIVAIGGGGGGGSGAREPSGTVSSGGAGGGGGAYTIRTVPAALLSATESVTVGSGGAGGAAVTADGTVGNPGVNGSNSVFKASTFLVANSGLLGAGGSTGAATGGSGGGGGSNGGAGASSSATGLVGSSGTSTGIAAPGGGSGGGVTTAPAASAGGAGGNVSSSGGNAGGTAGTAGNAGGAGVSVTANSPLAGTGGGGGGSATAAVGGTGGAGGLYGAGGGGGGASLNGSNSGAGGAGANGIVIVMTAT